MYIKIIITILRIVPTLSGQSSIWSRTTDCKVNAKDRCTNWWVDWMVCILHTHAPAHTSERVWCVWDYLTLVVRVVYKQLDSRHAYVFDGRLSRVKVTETNADYDDDHNRRSRIYQKYTHSLRSMTPHSCQIVHGFSNEPQSTRIKGTKYSLLNMCVFIWRFESHPEPIFRVRVVHQHLA